MILAICGGILRSRNPKGAVTLWGGNHAGRVIEGTEDNWGQDKVSQMSYNAAGSLMTFTVKNSATGDLASDRTIYGTGDGQNDLWSRVEALKLGSATPSGYEYLG